MDKTGKLQVLGAYLHQHKKQLILLVICLIITGSVCKRYLTKKPATVAAAAAKVQVDTVKKVSDFNAGLDTTASLQANADVVLKSKVDSYVKKMYLAKGQTFSVGELLVEMDHANQSAQVQSAQAQIDMNQAAAASAQSTLHNAATDQQRYDTLIAKGYATRQEVDSKRTSTSTAAADYNKAISNIAYAQAQLSAAEATLNDYYFKAPFAGVVLDDYNMSVGSKVATDTSVLRIADISLIKAAISIPEQQLENIKDGMQATLTCDSLPNKQFTGTIRNINSFVDTATHTVQADIYIDNAAYDYVLKPGMFAKVYVVEKALHDVLVIPSEALRKDNTVFVVHDHKVVAVKVTPGLSFKKQLAVTGGLQAGDVVITSGGNNLKAGDEVTYDENK